MSRKRKGDRQGTTPPSGNAVVSRPALKVRVPGPDEPGYLRRMVLLGRGQAQIQAGDVSGFADFAEGLADCITAPDGIDPYEALLDLSEREFGEILAAFAALGKVPNEPGVS
jgi:hypothetical protein